MNSHLYNEDWRERDARRAEFHDAQWPTPARRKGHLRIGLILTVASLVGIAFAIMGGN